MKFSFKNKAAAYVPALAAAAVLSLSSCSDSFLDRDPNGYQITEDQLNEAMKWNTKVMLGEMQGISTNLIQWRAGGTTDQDDFGQKSVDIATDIMAGDIVYPYENTYGWFRDDCRLSSADLNGRQAQTNWYYYYKVINSANFVLGTAGSDVVEPENAQNKLYFAQAKTARGFAYYKLATLYSKGYDLEKDKKRLPVYREQSSTYAAPQTIDSVYRQAIFDFTGAIKAYENAAAAGVSQSGIDQPSIAVAYTLLAYTYLDMGRYAEAEDAAAKGIAAAEKAGKRILKKSELYNGFNSVSTPDWMWGMDITAENTGGLCTFWGMMDLFTYSYTFAGDFKVMNQDLFLSMGDNDARAKWFYGFNEAGGQPAAKLLMPINKFYSASGAAAAGRDATTGTVNLYAYDDKGNPKSYNGGGDRNWESDIHFMRIEEPYMIAAEAAARQGKLGEARTYLGAILAERDADAAAAIQTMSQADLLEEIYKNWRVEFWGEGKALQTIKRFKKSATRPANDYYNSIGTVNYDDDRFTFAVPNSELSTNPLMKDVDK